MGSLWYRLEGKKVVQTSMLDSAFQLAQNRHIGLNTINGCRVSTVFLCLDHSFLNDGPPIVFETMIFGGKHDDFQERYCTYDQAEEGHKRAIEFVFNRRKLDKHFYTPIIISPFYQVGDYMLLF